MIPSVFSDAALRKKWKYLRDQFAVEVGKYPPPRPGDHPESKWPYMKSLMFLLGIVKPRAPSRNLRSNDSSSEHQEENVELVAENIKSETGPTEGDEEMVESQVSDTMTLHDSQPTQPDDYSTRTNSPSSEEFSRKRKRTDVSSNCNQQVLSLGEIKASLLERVVNECGCNNTDNEDALFFRSLLPHVSRIPQRLKLRFRNGVQQLVDEFAYGSASSI